MTLPSSGSISLSDIASEFGVSAPYSLSDFYRGGANVPDTPTNSGVPTSGSISLTDFYGASAALPASWSTGSDMSVSDEAYGATITSSSRTATVTNGPITLSLSGHASRTWSVNGGAFSSGSKSVSNGDTVRLRVVSSSDPLTARAVTLSGNGDSLTFTVTTGDFGG